MIKNKEDLMRTMNELEVLIQETEETMDKAYKASESMVEPAKSKFLDELNIRKVQLDTNKIMLEHFKLLAGD
jgi:ElaB/YqjD/DUF883 family membrane-anchored ribosome-binding protein